MAKIIRSLRYFIIAGCLSLALWLEDPAETARAGSLAANAEQHPED